MAPSAHLDWFADNVDWFGALDSADLAGDVPACPGWTVGDVMFHLTGGLGVGYPWALGADVDAAHDRVFLGAPFPLRADDVVAQFRAVMSECLAVFRSTEPTRPAYTYAGPGVAGFWFRRAAIETSLHRMDVADALGLEDRLVGERGLDAVAESVEFALPLAATWTGAEPDAMVVRVDDAPVFVLGSGVVAAEVSGSADGVLRTLWGRHADDVSVAGDEATTALWLSLVERAFAGR